MNLKYGVTIGIYSPSIPITAFCPIWFKRAKEFLIFKLLVFTVLFYVRSLSKVTWRNRIN